MIDNVLHKPLVGCALGVALGMLILTFYWPAWGNLIQSV